MKNPGSSAGQELPDFFAQQDTAADPGAADPGAAQQDADAEQGGDVGQEGIRRKERPGGVRSGGSGKLTGKPISGDPGSGRMKKGHCPNGQYPSCCT